MITPQELARRRRILGQHIGSNVAIKYATLSATTKRRAPIVGELVDVKRKRAELDFGPSERFDEFGYSGRWLVPIANVLLPGSVEPAPGQRELFQ